MNNNETPNMSWCRKVRIRKDALRKAVGRLVDCDTNSAATVASLYQ